MRSFKKYSLFVAAPLALAASGCVGGGGWLASRGNTDPAFYQQRLANAAQQYEAAGQYESAQKMYAQLAQQQPNNQVARQKVQELAQKAKSGGAADAAAAPADKSTQALRMLAQIQSQHRQELMAKRAAKPPRNSDELLADLELRLNEFKAQRALTEAATAARPVAAAKVDTGKQIAEVTNADAGATAVLESPTDQTEAPVIADSSSADGSTPSVDWWGTNGEAQPSSIAAANTPLPGIEDSLPAPPDHESNALPEVIPSGDRDWQQTSVARLCESIPDELAPAVALLDHADADQRIAGLSELAGYGESAQPVAPAVHALLSYDDAAVRAYAAEAVFAIEGNSHEAVNTLTSLLADNDEAVVQLSCYMLGRMGVAAEQAASHLEVTMSEASGITHLHAAEALVRIIPGHAEAYAALSASLESDDRNERWFGVVALGSVSGDQTSGASEVLKAALHDSESDVRAAAALSLGGMGESADGVIEELEQVALFDEQNVRDAASTALACLRR